MIVNKIGKRIEDAVVNQMVSVEWKIVGEVHQLLYILINRAIICWF